MHHALGIRSPSFALSCIDNRHQRQQAALYVRVLRCSVSIWLSGILLGFILRLERTEFSLKSWQAEQTKFPGDFPALAARCKERSPSRALAAESRLEQQCPAETQSCRAAARGQLLEDVLEWQEGKILLESQPWESELRGTCPAGSATKPGCALPAEQHPRRHRRRDRMILCLKHKRRSLQTPGGEGHQPSGKGDYNTHHFSDYSLYGLPLAILWSQFLKLDLKKKKAG